MGIGSRVSGTGCRESGIERHGAVDEILSSYKAARYVTAEAIGHSRMRLGARLTAILLMLPGKPGAFGWSEPRRQRET